MHLALKLGTCLLLYGSITTSLFAQQPAERPVPVPVPEVKDEGGFHLVATNEVAAQLSAGSVGERITGRVSFHLVTTPSEARGAQVLVRGFNIAFFGVSQEPLAGRAPVHESLGFLGFSALPGKFQSLRYDPRTRRLYGELRMFADASFLSALARPTGDSKTDVFDTPTIPVKASIMLELDGPLPDRGTEAKRMKAKLDVRLHADPSQYDKFQFPGFDVRVIEGVRVSIDLAPIFFFEAAQRVCVQPIRLLRFQWRFPFPLVQLSGAGLAFGSPGANHEWAKGDIVFQFRDWKTILASAYWTLTSGEADSLRAEVDDDDCIEIFFVHNLSPEDQWGGGATWGSGTGSAKIISSDANARYGIDFTHLAHELGHVLGLRHPGDASTASAVPASTGTLMCPSGFKNDNPQINSQENKESLSNPLLTFALKLRSPGPDCDDSPDCGACP